VLKARVMPCLLLRNEGLVKTVRFKDFAYVGDPINAVRIYNDMEVDELVLLDILATSEGREPPFKLIEEIAGECFMPLAYGGGVRTVEHMRKLFSRGVEKVILNTAAHDDPGLIAEAASLFGSQAVVVSIDAKRGLFGKYEAVVADGKRRTGLDPVEYARRVEAAGAGEILITSIDRDGTWEGYDLELTRRVSDAVSIPVIASGGAGSVDDIGKAVKEAHASAAALGSMVVFQAKGLGVLIKFPKQADLSRVLG
jgi:imidazole glycerol-phosphate synthase subunit HisF